MGVAQMELKRNPGPLSPHFATLHAGYGSRYVYSSLMPLSRKTFVQRAASARK
jgi:hypothetical protein